MVAIAGVMGGYYLLSQIADGEGESEGGEASGRPLLTVASLLLGYAAKTYYDIQWRIDTYKTTVMHSLYDNTTDTNDGVLVYLAEALVVQELKETMIAYALLVELSERAGGEGEGEERGGVNEHTLDKEAERFLASLEEEDEEEGGEVRRSVDFEHDDACDKVVALGLAEVRDDPASEGTVCYRPLPLGEALAHCERLVTEAVVLPGFYQEELRGGEEEEEGEEDEDDEE